MPKITITRKTKPFVTDNLSDIIRIKTYDSSIIGPFSYKDPDQETADHRKHC